MDSCLAKIWLRVCAGMLLCISLASVARAQVLTVSASPATVSFALAQNGTAGGNTSIAITTSWTLLVAPLSVTLYAYASSPGAALTDGSGHNIPSSSVLGSSDGGAYTAFVGNSPFATGTSITIFQKTATISLNGSHNDTLALEINTTGLNLPAATYSGTLTLRAQIL